MLVLMICVPKSNKNSFQILTVKKEKERKGTMLDIRLRFLTLNYSTETLYHAANVSAEDSKRK
jgi:hypothetical protein